MIERAVPGVTGVTNVQKHIARYNFMLKYCEDKMVLDLGCGVGYGTHLLSWVADGVSGIDISPEAIEIATHAYPLINGVFAVHDAESLSGEFFAEWDIVVALEVLEHLKDPVALFNKIEKGLFGFSVPLGGTPGANPYHLHAWTLEEVRDTFVAGNLLYQERLQAGVSLLAPEDFPSSLKPKHYVAVIEKR